MEEKLLEIKDLRVEYKTMEALTKAVNGVNLTINKGESLGLVGETGAGKTTTALSIMRLISSPPGKIVGGSIKFKGEEILDMSQEQLRKLRGKKISMIFQDPMTALNPVLTVGEQISEVIYLHQGITKDQSVPLAIEMMEKVGIEGERYSDYPHQFSGGMKQRIVIAIALACNPELLLADEPTTALDVTIQAQVLRLINDLKKDLGTSLLLITHDLGVVAEVCDKAAIMYAGEIVESGTVEHIFNNTQHPYTEGLFGSIPKLNEDVKRLKPIKGLMSDPTNLPDGCYFAERCPYAEDACKSGIIPVTETEPGHLVKCLRYRNR